MLLTAQREAARRFAEFWKGKGYEKGQSQPFWLSLLHEVFGVAEPEKYITFEDQVHLDNTSFIDGYIDNTHVMIEQKSLGKDLKKPIRQSDGSLLTPYEQAKRYSLELPYSKRPRWIVTSNFESFLIYDMEHPGGAPQMVLLANLEKEYHMLSFLVDQSKEHINKEMEVSIQAGEIVGVLYDKILSQYRNPEDPETQKSLNKLCVRLVFCLYAEDAGIFGSKDMFHDYMAQFGAGEFREKLIKLFRILDQKPEDRDPYEDEKLLAFPYVNGGMFAGEIEIPRINEEIRSLILQRASDDFDWSMISPTIFGAVFESTLNSETRRVRGMHYTSIENIHKVIDPLFLDDLKTELADIKATSVAKIKRERAFAFQDKLAGLKFFDPACGSGNFLTESYTSLRRLENDALRIIYGDNRVIGEMAEPIKVSINQFYGIEINDFACSVAQTALWIAESQMMQETDEIVGFNLDPLPLKTYTNIREGNALRMDWDDIIPATELDYIMGNPPFVGANQMNEEQREDLRAVFGSKWKNIGEMDYVTGWYKKSCDMMLGTRIVGALVSTNSITQGEQVANLWKPLFKTGVRIKFAYQTFVWDSEAPVKARVHCVIVGFTYSHVGDQRLLFDRQGVKNYAKNINAYLMDAPNFFIESRSKPLCNVPAIRKGNQPTDGGFLIIEADELQTFLDKEPQAERYVKRLIGAKEYINNKVRYCLWLKDATPSELRSMPVVMERMEGVRKMRLASPDSATRALADYPHLFRETNNPNTYIIVPSVSSERRQYIPMGFLTADTIPTNLVLIIPEANTYDFGILASSLHMAWMRAVAGRLKSDYRYSKDIVYNNFPWPKDVSDTQKEKIEQSAQAILDARALYPDSSLAALYNSLTMPPELRKAHRANDAAVLEAYGFPKNSTESDIVTHLFKMYQELTKYTDLIVSDI